MKFNSQLTEAILLKRTLGFLAEVVLPSRQKLMIRCPNLGQMTGCDVLGSKVWYSNAVGYHCLPTWELVEVDGGHVVSINPEIIKPLVIEGIQQEIIEEFAHYSILHTGGVYEQYKSQYLILEKDQDQCYVGLEHVILADDRGDGFYPEYPTQGYENLKYLMQARADGHRAVLMYCVTREEVENLKPANHIDFEYCKMLKTAISQGVEVIAYKTEISLNEVTLTTPLPVLISEDLYQQ